MKLEQIGELPIFDTGQYEDSEFAMAGRAAKLTIRFVDLPPFEINFHGVRWHQFTALPNCDAALIEGAYFRLVKVIESSALSSFVDGDRAPTKAYGQLHHFRIFLDETGCHELFAESASAGTAIGALSLDDTRRWADLKHAYGSAGDIPALLRQLFTLPASEDRDEPWFYLWSALAHQGDVYSASFAAVPHVVRALAIAPAKADLSFFQFPARVEICRRKMATPIPEDLRQAYFDALAQLPSLAAAAAGREWDDNTLVSVLSAIAAAKGYGEIAEAAQELTRDVATEFMEWFFNR